MENECTQIPKSSGIAQLETSVVPSIATRLPNVEAISITTSFGAPLDSDNFLEGFESSELGNDQWWEAKEKRDREVGELLREMYYLERSEPPNAWRPELQSEADYWAGKASMSPGYDPDKVRAELIRRKCGAPQAVDYDEMMSPDRRLRRDVLVLADVGLRSPIRIEQFPQTPTKGQIAAAMRDLLQAKIEEHGDWRPVPGALDIAVNMLTKHTRQRYELFK